MQREQLATFSFAQGYLFLDTPAKWLLFYAKYSCDCYPYSDCDR